MRKIVGPRRIGLAKRGNGLDRVHAGRGSQHGTGKTQSVQLIAFDQIKAQPAPNPPPRPPSASPPSWADASAGSSARARPRAKIPGIFKAVPLSCCPNNAPCPSFAAGVTKFGQREEKLVTVVMGRTWSRR